MVDSIDLDDKVAEAIMYYNAMNLHLKPKSDYDFVKFNGKVRKPSDVKNHQLYWQVLNLYKKFDYDRRRYIEHLYLVYRENDFKSVTMKMMIRRSAKPIVSFDEVIEKTLSEMKTIKKFENENDLYPVIYNMYMDGEVQLETLFTYDKYVNKILEEKASRDIVYWPKRIKELRNISGLFFFILNMS